MIHRSSWSADDWRYSWCTRSVLTCQIQPGVKFFFFGSGRVGPAAEIPSLPRKKFQIKKRNRWHHLFSVHASRILKINQNILICSLGRRYLPSTNFHLPNLSMLLAESILPRCSQKRPEVGDDLSSWTISCSRNESNQHESKSNSFRRQGIQG